MKISLVVPVFNEEDAIPLFYQTVKDKLANYKLEIVFVNDGSTDSTERIINSLAESDTDVIAVNFIRNFGKESALLAGLTYATGDAMIPIDVDLQDPIEVIPALISRWQDGWPVVLAKRSDRRCDSRFKRKTAGWFYSLHNKISSLKIEENVGDFRLLSRETVDNIKQLQERNLFMKGILSWVAGDAAIVEYTREERAAGKTKFNGWKLWNLALEGLTSFSTIPLRIWTYIGFVVATFSLLYGAWMIIDELLWGNKVAGYPSILVSILFIGGVQLIGVGMLGEYIGRIYIETKKRPRYLVKELRNKNK